MISGGNHREADTACKSESAAVCPQPTAPAASAGEDPTDENPAAGLLAVWIRRLGTPPGKLPQAAERKFSTFERHRGRSLARRVLPHCDGIGGHGADVGAY